MNNKFEIKDKKTSELYETMWGEVFDDFLMDKIEKSFNLRYKKKSDNSYSFKESKNECKAKTLERIFEIENKELFCAKYEMATGGAGNEGYRILTLHSSSLCALLHFYNVTEDNSLILEFDTDKGKRKVRFTKSFFEYKNNVIKNPSNMDIVLLGKDENEEIILFLESKFSEYYMGESSVLNNISKGYETNDYSGPFYKEDFLNVMGLHMEKGQEGFFKLKSDERFYIGGIKQMISHYVGVMNSINSNLFEGEKPEEHKEIDEAIKNPNTKVILGEIIFDNRIGELKLKSNAEKGCAEIYKEKYRILADKIRELTKGNKRFEIIKDILSYDDLYKDKKYKIEKNIKYFYRY